MITIKDIARESGYSVGTVSRVLNGHKNVSDKARTQIMAVVDKYNFQLNGNAKLLKQRGTRGAQAAWDKRHSGSTQRNSAYAVQRFDRTLPEKTG